MRPNSNYGHRMRSVMLLADLLGIAEILGGLALLAFRQDATQGFALMAIGAATSGGSAGLWARRPGAATRRRS